MEIYLSELSVRSIFLLTLRIANGVVVHRHWRDSRAFRRLSRLSRETIYALGFYHFDRFDRGHKRYNLIVAAIV